MSSQSSDNNVPFAEFINKKLKHVFKSGMTEKGLPHELLDVVSDFLPDSPMELIFNPEKLSLDQWIAASKKVDLLTMFKVSSGKKRWDILIAINRWLVNGKQDSLLESSSTKAEDRLWVSQILKNLYLIVHEEYLLLFNPNQNTLEKEHLVREYQKYFKVGNYDFLHLIYNMKWPAKTFSKRQLFCLDHYWRFDNLYKNNIDVERFKQELQTGYFSQTLGNQISNVESIDQLKAFFENCVPSNLKEDFLLNLGNY